MAAADELDRTLESVDPFWDEDGGPIFPPEAIRLLESIPDVEQELLRVATDAEQPPARRFAAVEALFQGGWTSWRSGPEGPAVAGVMADAIRADGIHNRWGLPGHYVGRSGKDLLSIEDGVEEALLPLLDDQKLLTIGGGETATVAHSAGYRVADLAGYLLAERRGEPFGEDWDPAARDRILERLRRGG
jgi:hypothetical protein